ncbi:hypothetical protein TARUN_897 [Trichoderma arundinaceum]|uniref:Queuosine 5'-phosphate N-glycosylase/hydrolase n=1 Tax=Trichoderma arundinaceum TaxID=490622 RepID=A0A395NZ91_TRIAR|nr:hypothetical protein TARUN_897 [Trichoderma arundinaceum]
MSDDEADPELLALLRQHLQGVSIKDEEPETGVLPDAEYVYNHGIDVAIDMRSTKRAAETIYAQMQEKSYSTSTWSSHELHPKTKDEATVAFIFTMDLLNFSFWSELPDDERFAIEYKGKRWTGYWSLVAAMQRALEEDIPITDPHFWQNEDECNLESLRHVFRSCTEEEMPLLQERLDCLRESGNVLYEVCRTLSLTLLHLLSRLAYANSNTIKKYDCSVVNLISAANGSAAQLVNLLARDFDCFRDEHPFEGRRNPIRIMKRAQIFVADVWACFEGKSYGEFRDIDKITMFADYRVPQILSTLGALYIGPQIDAAIRDKKLIESACSIWCVELIRREIQNAHPDTHVNAILIDFFLYDTMKEMEAQGKETTPHHRTRSIWY